ncbi:glycoside hydrolase family 65 protein [Caulobacter sp. 17J80-11]|uniref:glycoside hydrolase family 65 protein n=1 Tax=Caulobacter sp. 17J80-11 TaxID=2763502 RepID=UPI0016536C1A|nr:glycoside hydrolase family 65 protein [Caulobacter sp. 17J80-11]MBC6980710.1 glycoside hydrolase family 65 protein [Caulobacter sp. 17J80-11]
MSSPINPQPVPGSSTGELPAFVSNGVVGLRVRSDPLVSGACLVSSYAGEHPEKRIEAAALAPYPLACQVGLDNVWSLDESARVEVEDQSYDFATGELSSRAIFDNGGKRVRLETVTFCSRNHPSLACQEVVLTVDSACDLGVRAMIDGRNVGGRLARWDRATPGEAEPACDGYMLWDSEGVTGTCGLAYVTELVGEQLEPSRPAARNRTMWSEYRFRARAGRKYRLRQIVSLVPGLMHRRPDEEAARLAAKARSDGFDRIRAENRAEWNELWKGRIVLVGADTRWQALADASFFYMNTSAHASSLASTSMFGLATWWDYHYYYGHVMWDLEAFVVPALSVMQPHAARGLLDYRSRHLEAARTNARIWGRRGLQFPWESAPATGEETAPLPGTGAWHADHVTLAVARAFAVHSFLTGDPRFLKNKAWPVLSGVAEWLESRLKRTPRGVEYPASMGVAERPEPADNAAYPNMAAKVALGYAVSVAERLGEAASPKWSALARDLVLPVKGKVVIAHDGYTPSEEKGATPDPLMGVFPLDYRLEPEIEAATLKFWLDLADEYVGAPMLSPLYGAWAARAGDRRLALRLLDEGYGKFFSGRFLQPLEYRPDKHPEQPRAGPFFANMGGFLASLLFGFPGIEPGLGEPASWCRRPVVLPQGWEAIEVERLWVHGRPTRLSAHHGAERAVLELGDLV